MDLKTIEQDAAKIVTRAAANIKQIFKCRMPWMNYVLKSGKTITFGADQKFLTSHPQEIAELQKEVDDGHQHIYRDPEELQIDTTLQDKIREAQKEVTLKILEEAKQAEAKQGQSNSQAGSQVAAGSGSNPQGTQSMSAAQLLNVSSTATLGTLAAGSSSGGVAAGPTK
jgi:hypothetical protein